jgi:hypothetical protein
MRGISWLAVELKAIKSSAARSTFVSWLDVYLKATLFYRVRMRILYNFMLCVPYIFVSMDQPTNAQDYRQV